MSFHLSRRRALAAALAVTAALVVSVTGFVGTANAAPPVYVVAGDDPNATGDFWGFHEMYYSELRATITDATKFGAAGTVNATFTIGAPRAVPLTARSLDGVDVYFLSARDVATAEVTVLQAFIARGGALIVNSNGPGFFDTTAWLGFTLSPRVVYGDGPAPYDTTHKAPKPSAVVAAQAGFTLMSGPFGSVGSFENWHSVAGFTASPANATVLARTTLTGPADSGSSTSVTLTNVATLAVFPAGAFGAGSGPVVATSDVDTYSNAYTSVDPVTNLLRLGYATDTLCTLKGTTNGSLARNTFAWIAAQKALIAPPTTSTTTTIAPTTTTVVPTTTTVVPTTTTVVPTTTTTIRRRRR